MTLFINLVFAEMTTLRYNIIDMHCTVFQQDNKMAEQVRRVWADQEGNARARKKKRSGLTSRLAKSVAKPRKITMLLMAVLLWYIGNIHNKAN